MAGTPQSGGKGGDYYQVLGVPFEATEDEIRQRYHAVVRTLHPDRRRPGDEVTDRFHQVQNAWRCLSDATRRLLYDLRNFGRSSLGRADGLGPEGAELEEKLVCLQKEQALRDVDNMQVVLERVLGRERKARGVLVRAALYGDLRLREELLEECSSGQRAIQAEDLVGPVLEVATPLQCLVEKHTIMLPGGAAASKADLPGFYNPLPLSNDAELSLYVLYDFKGALHEVIVGDRETLRMPLRRHAVPAGREPRGPFSPANILLLRKRAASGHGRAPRSAAGPAPQGGTLHDPRRAAPCVHAAQALAGAVAEYRLESLFPTPQPGEATPRELLAVALAAALLLAATAWTARRP